MKNAVDVVEDVFGGWGFFDRINRIYRIENFRNFIRKLSYRFGQKEILFQWKK